MRTAGLLCLCCVSLAAQPAASTVSIHRGVLLERDPQASGGELSVRLDDSEVLRFQFDGKTSVERDSYAIDVPRLRPGEKVDVQSDSVDGSLLPYARAIHVIPAAVAATPRRHLMIPLADERPLWRPSLSLSGVVGRLLQGRILLHTRDGDRTVLLLPDTRYFADGDIVDAASLRPNMRVFIQAGTNLNDEVEGYRVIWGKILAPVPPNW